MDSKLVKLIDYSLLPFSLTILGKTLGLYLVLNSMGIEWGVADFSYRFISVTPVVYGRDLGTVATYSNLIMYVALFLGLSFYLFLAALRQDKKLSVVAIRRLMQLRFLNVFQKGVYLYTRLSVWLVYLWLVTAYILLDVALGRSAIWLGGFVFILSTVVSVTLFADIIREYNNLITIARQKDYI